MHPSNNGRPVTDFPESSRQLNDTHPAIAVAEPMRLLVDDQRVDWTRRDLTRRTFAYTNHTLLPEALETWPVSLFENAAAPLEIIHEINRRFLEQVASAGRTTRTASGADVAHRRARRALVRMAHLACVGSHAVNGVAELHTRLLGETCCVTPRPGPEKFQNKTNGVTPRRFLMLSNPELGAAHESIAPAGWTDLSGSRA